MKPKYLLHFVEGRYKDTFTSGVPSAEKCASLTFLAPFLIELAYLSILFILEVAVQTTSRIN